MPDGAADLGLLMQIFDKERVIKSAFISTLNFYKDLKTKDDLPESYLRQYIKILLENKIYL